MGTRPPIIALVTRETRLAELKARWATSKAAAFRLKQAAVHEVELRRKRRARGRGPVADADEAELAVAAGALADEEEYEHEDEVYHRSLQQLMRELDLDYPVKTVDRGFLPNFDFGRCIAVVVRAMLEPIKDVDWRTLMAARSGGLDAKQLIAMAFRDLADNAEKIGSLNISPELLHALLGNSQASEDGAGAAAETGSGKSQRGWTGSTTRRGVSSSRTSLWPPRSPSRVAARA